MRSSARKHVRNIAVKSQLRTLEKNFLGLVKAGKKEDAKKAYQTVASKYDKAAKTGVIHRGKADRKKSRLALGLNSAAK